jgi:hypothetical protein
MPPAKRLAVALQGAILWVLLSCGLGLLPWLVISNEATANIPWIAAAFGVVGAVSHAVVSAIKPEPLNLHTSVAAVSTLCCFAFLSLAYWMLGTPSQPLQELPHIILLVVAPAVGLSYAVLLFQRRLGAA